METKASPDYDRLKDRVRRLSAGPNDPKAVEDRLRKLETQGLPKREIPVEDLAERKPEILDRIQENAEAYEQVSQSCAKSSLLAVMEAFGLGRFEMVKALSPFPGVALTGETCGAVSGGMAALGLYFGKDDLLDYGANARTYGKCRKFIQRFLEEMGTTKCREIHEKVVFGRYYETADPEEGYPGFIADKGFEKCGLPPGMGARIAAEIIIEDMMKKR